LPAERAVGGRGRIGAGDRRSRGQKAGSCRFGAGPTRGDPGRRRRVGRRQPSGGGRHALRHTAHGRCVRPHPRLNLSPGMALSFVTYIYICVCWCEGGAAWGGGNSNHESYESGEVVNAEAKDKPLLWCSMICKLIRASIFL
jgi:hypothetical protein